MLETLVLQCLLCALGQAGEGASPAQAPSFVSPLIPIQEAPVDRELPVATADATPGEPQRPASTAPVAHAPGAYRPTPPELVAEALMLPPGHTLAGQPLTLASVLATVQDRAEQLRAIAAYWRMVEAVALYRFHLDYDRQLRTVVAGPEQAARLAAARAAAKAQLGRAELQAIETQHEVAAFAGMAGESLLPLPADRPHVGQYITRFRELFAGKAAPPAARRLDRTLPIRFQTIEMQSQAVAAAEDAMAAQEAASAQAAGFAQGASARPDGDVSGRLAGISLLHRQRCEWISAVCRYNQEIAEYAVAVAPPTANGSGLVGLLIRPGPEVVRPLVSDDGSSLQPATMLEPIRDPALRTRPAAPAELPDVQGRPIPGARAMPGEPTPARRPATSPSSGADGESNAAPGAAQGADDVRPPGTLLPQRPIVPIDQQTLDRTMLDRTALESAALESAALERPAGGAPIAPGPWLPAAVAERDVVGDGPILDGGLTTSLPPGHVVRRPVAVLAPLYPGLASASPGTQAKQLTATLHWNRSLPEPNAPMELLECLRRRTGMRRDVVAAYWGAKQHAAAYQAWQQHRQWLEELSHATEEPAASARIRAARLAAEASMLASQADLLEWQARLAEELGRGTDSVWPMPATRPHSGLYLLQVESLPPDAVRGQPLRRLVDAIPRLSASVWDHAAAVVEADAARAEAEAAWLNGAIPMEELISSLDRQTDQTLHFLVALTAYNTAIAEYALAVLPSDTPAESLVQTLVMAE